MNIKELEKKMAELDELQAETENAHAKLIAQMAELKERGEEKPKPPHPRWEPENGERYYYLDCDGWIESSETISSECKKYKADIGNLFNSVEEAKFAAERLKVLAEMREWAGKWDDTFVLTYIGNDDFVQISSVLMSRNTFGEMRFATKEDAEGCIKAVGKERLLRYYFMVPEEDDNGID